MANVMHFVQMDPCPPVSYSKTIILSIIFVGVKLSLLLRGK